MTSTTGGSFSNPQSGNTDWSFSVPALTSNDDKVYVATRTFTSDGASPQDSSWSTPAIYAQRTDGTPGDDGVGTRQVNLYKLNDSTFTSTTAGTFADPKSGANSGWDYDVPALTNTTDKVYVVSRIFTSDGNSPQDASWSTPVIYAQKGKSAIVTVLSNEAHTVPAASNGTVSSFAGSGTDIQVFEGTTQLTYDGSSPYSNSTFRVSASGSSVSPGSATTVSGNTRRFANVSNMSADIATITYTIVVKDSAGEETTFTRVQSFSKSISGTDGDDGDDGDAGATLSHSFITTNVIRKDKDGSYSGTNLDMEVEVRREGTLLARERYRVSRSGDSWNTNVTTLTSGYTRVNGGQLSPAASVVDNSIVVTVTWNQDSSTTAGTFFLVADGETGAAGQAAATLSTTYLTTNVIQKDSSGSYNATDLQMIVEVRRQGTLLARRRFEVTRNGDSWSSSVNNMTTNGFNYSQLSATGSVSGNTILVTATWNQDSSTTTGSFSIVSDGTAGAAATSVSVSPVSLTKGTNDSPSTHTFVWVASSGGTQDSITSVVATWNHTLDHVTWNTTSSLATGWSRSVTNNSSSAAQCTLTFNGASATALAFYDATQKCLTPDMLLKRSGLLVKAIDVKLGDLISTPKGDTKVTKIINPHERDVFVVLNDELEITPDHPILMQDNSYTTIDEIQIGDIVKSPVNSGTVIKSKEWKQGKIDTVYIETENGLINVYCNTNIYVIKGDY